MNSEQPNQHTWEPCLFAVEQFINREGHSRVPAKHIENHDGEEVRLGTWVRSVRRRYHKQTLNETLLSSLSTLSGWEWGPFRPGPSPNNSRDSAILKMRETGMSLQQIGTQCGLSRQRIHQIIKRGGK